MEDIMKKFIYWFPRILTIIYIVFLGLFALDAFDSSYSFWQTVQALLIHLIPNFALIIILIISWKREWIAGILFNLLAIFYIVWAWGRFPVVNYFIISGPLFLTGVLFLMNWKNRIRNA